MCLSRYVNVDEEAGRALFYAYVESSGQPETAPLILWLNGYAPSEEKTGKEPMTFALLMIIASPKWKVGWLICLDASECCPGHPDLKLHIWQLKALSWGLRSFPIEHLDKIWPDRGPGCSSLAGGFLSELGPYYPAFNGGSLQRNPYAWTQVKQSFLSPDQSNCTHLPFNYSMIENSFMKQKGMCKLMNLWNELSCWTLQVICFADALLPWPAICYRALEHLKMKCLSLFSCGPL